MDKLENFTSKFRSEISRTSNLASMMRLETMRFMPVASPGRGKRIDGLMDDDLFISAMSSLVSGIIEDDLATAMADAFKTKDMSVFTAIQEAKTYLDAVPHTSFSRVVMLTLRRKIQLVEKLGREPTKAEVKAATGLEIEPQRWTEIFRAAGLGRLPNGKPHAAKKAHGGRTRKR
jgi:hypothetical protein